MKELILRTNNIDELFYQAYKIDNNFDIVHTFERNNIPYIELLYKGEVLIRDENIMVLEEGSINHFLKGFILGYNYRTINNGINI